MKNLKISKEDQFLKSVCYVKSLAEEVQTSLDKKWTSYSKQTEKWKNSVEGMGFAEHLDELGQLINEISEINLDLGFLD